MSTLTIKLTKKEMRLQDRMKELRMLCEQASKLYLFQMDEYDKVHRQAVRLWDRIQEEFLGDKMGVQFIIYLRNLDTFIIRRARMTMGLSREFALNGDRHLAEWEMWIRDIWVLTARV